MPTSPPSTPVHSRHRSAAEAVLSLPEILIKILKFHFERSASLQANVFPGFLATLQVNRLWFECGTDKLWSGSWAAPHLLQVPPPRRQIYASKISYVTASYSFIQENYSEFRDLEFSRLKELDIDLTGKMHYRAQYIEPYFVPSLRFFSFLGPSLNADILLHLRNSCRGLKTVLLRPERSRITPALFHEFIRNAPSLHMIIFSTETDYTSPISNTLLSCLARNRKISCLELPWSWTEHAVFEAAVTTWEAGIVPFPVLEELELSAPSSAIHNFVSLAGSLKNLKLTVKDSKIDVLWHVSNLVNLRSLTLAFEQPAFISAGALMALGALKELQTLDLGPDDSTDISLVTSNFSDDNCEILASHLPSLYHLEFRIQCDISTNALISFARHCRKLCWCAIFQPLDTQNLFTGAYGHTICPGLRLLYLGGLIGEDVRRRLTSVQFSLSFERLFPNLQEFSIEYTDRMDHEYYQEAFGMWKNRGVYRNFSWE